LNGIDDPESTLFVGQMLCPPANPIPLANEIEIRIQTFPALSVPLIKGTELSCHHQSSEMVAVVSKLISRTPIAFASSAMDEAKDSKKPRRIGKNEYAVIRLKFSHTLCIEAYEKNKQLGRLVLRQDGVTVASGMVIGSRLKKHR
jgi:elongation factor 1 alpha-like protein